MNILYYTHAFWPQIGGIETFSLRLIEGLEACSDESQKLDLIVVTNTPGPEYSTEHNFSAPVVRKPNWLHLWRLIGAADRVVLAGAAILPLTFSLLQRKKLIITHHGYQTICPNGLLFHLPTRTDCPGYFGKRNYAECVRCGRSELSWLASMKRVLLTFIRRLLAKGARRNVMLSSHLSERLQLPNSVIIRNGVPLISPNLTPDVSTASCGEQLSFAYVGRLVIEKGAHVLIDAARILKGRGKNFCVLLLGEGPERNTLMTQARDANLSETVRFLGFRTGAELQAALAEPCVLVMPSVCQDVAPFAPLEQMMAGRGVIASDIGGLSEEVGDAGLKFRPGDSEELADQMERILENPGLLAELGEKAVRRAREQYSAEKMILEYRKLLSG